MSTSLHLRQRDIDGVVAASGPGLEEEIKPFLDSDIPIVFVNFAICRVEVKRSIFLIKEIGCSVHLSSELVELPWQQHIQHVHWKPKPWSFSGSHKMMEVDDWPDKLVDHAFTKFSALHFLICKGCRNIYGAGVNLRAFPGGNYSQYCDVVDFSFVFDQIRGKYEKFVRPDLERLGVKFESEGLK